MTEAVHEYEGSWWFYDEIWSERIGPYPTREEAVQACLRYARDVLGPHHPGNGHGVDSVSVGFE